MIRNNWVLVTLPPTVVTVMRTSLVCPGAARFVGTVTSMWVSVGVPTGGESEVAPSNLTATGGHPKLVPFSRIVCPAGPFGGKGGLANAGAGTTRAARNVSSLTTAPPALRTVTLTSTNAVPLGTRSPGTLACSCVADGVPARGAGRSPNSTVVAEPPTVKLVPLMVISCPTIPLGGLNGVVANAGSSSTRSITERRLTEVGHRQPSLAQICDHRLLDGVRTPWPAELGQYAEVMSRRRFREVGTLGHADHPRRSEANRGLHSHVQRVGQLRVFGAVHVDQKHIEVHRVDPRVRLWRGGRRQGNYVRLVAVVDGRGDGHLYPADEKRAGATVCGRDAKVLFVLARRQGGYGESVRRSGEPVADVPGEQRPRAGGQQIVLQVEIPVEDRNALLDVQAYIAPLQTGLQQFER